MSNTTPLPRRSFVNKLWELSHDEAGDVFPVAVEDYVGMIDTFIDPWRPFMDAEMVAYFYELARAEGYR